MASTEREQVTVLVVDDDPDVADMYRRHLDAEFEVSTAYGGDDALARLEEVDVDVVLLDRMMPDVSGDEVLRRIEARGHRCKVAMVTAVEPDFDILSMGFDDYVTKPVSKADLVETVEKLVALSTYTETVRRYRSLLAKRAALAAEKSAIELETSPEFLSLERQIADVEARIATCDVDLADDTTFVAAIRDIETSGGSGVAAGDADRNGGNET